MTARKSKPASTIKLKDMRSVCPITNTLEIIGDKWTLLVIRDLFAGKTTYGEFQNSPEQIPTNILADRLKRLTHYGIIDKSPYQDRPVRYAYSLTDRGRSLGPVIESIVNWGLDNIKKTEARIKSGSY